jgi:hypothetical protein
LTVAISNSGVVEADIVSIVARTKAAILGAESYP